MRDEKNKILEYVKTISDEELCEAIKEIELWKEGGNGFGPRLDKIALHVGSLIPNVGYPITHTLTTNACMREAARRFTIFVKEKLSSDEHNEEMIKAILEILA